MLHNMNDLPSLAALEAMLQTLLQRLSTRRWRAFCCRMVAVVEIPSVWRFAMCPGTAQELEGLLEQVKSTLLLRDAEPGYKAYQSIRKL